MRTGLDPFSFVKSTRSESEAVAALAATDVDKGVSFRCTQLTNDEIDLSKSGLIGTTQSPPAMINGVKVSVCPVLSHGWSPTHRRYSIDEARRLLISSPFVSVWAAGKS